jgi:tetratricopeptide (TPR) repeat protein
LIVWVRSERAVRLATISARIASTAPSRPLGAPRARPDCAARAALTASSGSDQQLTGDYPAAAASHQQALELCRNAGDRIYQAETLNCLGELASRTADGRQARDYHAQALAIARELGASPEEARALEGIGRSHLRDGHASEAAACLEQALAIYQRIAAPATRRVQETLTQSRQDHPAPAPEP